MGISTLLGSCGGESRGGEATIDEAKKATSVDHFHAARTKASKLVDEFTYNDFVKSLTTSSDFVLDETHNISVGGKNLIITAKHIKGWEDPGDFLRFELSNKEGDVFIDEINVDGWVNFGDNYPVPQELLSQNKLKSNKFLWIKMNNKNYLFLVGWMYSGAPGTMTVVDLDVQKICVNKKFKITGIKDHTKDNVMDLLGKVSLVDEAVIDINGEDIINL